LDFDAWALAQSSAPSFWFGLRYFNVYGPFEGHKGGQASMVYHGYQQATRTGAIRLFKSNTPKYADGDQVRDFVYVKDIVRVTTHLLRLSLSGKVPDSAQDLLPAKSRGCFVNVGTGEARSWNDLAVAVFDAIAVPKKIEYILMPDNIAGQYQNYTCAQLTTLRALGYEAPLTSLEQGVREYVQRYLMRGL
jgi:ADP-L-glycero-D-manno-heptose 6-epimerase